MKEEIQKLISLGDTEKALALLATKLPNDTVLLQAQYVRGKKEFNLNLIDYGDWQRIQARVNYAALELAGKAEEAGAEPAKAGQAGPKQKVFISYSWDDQPAALQVKKFLEAEGCAVTIDVEDMAAGSSILQFIQDGIKNADAVVSIVSGKSLQSGWVGGESVAAMYAVWLADKKFIPVRLDNVAFDIDFQIAAQETLNTKIKELKAKIKKLEQLDGDPRAFRDDLNRMNELKNNLGKIIQRFNSVLMLDITDVNFDSNMKKVVAGIKA